MAEKKVKVRFTHNGQEVEMRESVAKAMEGKNEPNRVEIVKGKPGRPRKTDRVETQEPVNDD